MNTAAKLIQIITLGIGFAIIWGILASCIVDTVAPLTSRENHSRIYTEQGDLYLQTSSGTRRWDQSSFSRLDPMQITLSPANLPKSPNIEQPLIDRRWQPTVVAWRDLNVQKIDTADNNATYVNHGDYYYFIYPHRTISQGYFVIYDGRTRQVKHYLGKSGFTASSPPAEDCFDVFGNHADSSQILTAQESSLSDPSFYSDISTGELQQIHNYGSASHFTSHLTFLRTADSKIYHVDLRQGSLKSLTDEPVIQMARGSFYVSRFNAENRLLVRFAETIRSYDRDAKLTGEWKIPDELRDQDLNVVETADHNLIIEWRTKDVPQKEYIFSYAIVAPDGSMIAQHNDVDRTPAAFDFTRYHRMRNFAVIPVPVIVLTSIFSSTTINTEFSGAAIGDEIMRSTYDFLDYILLSLALSISLAVIFAVRQRQNGRPIIWWQIALITLFGPPAFVAIVWTTPVASKKLFSRAYPLLGTEILA